MPLGKSKKQRREAKCRRSVRGYRPGEGKSKNKGTRQSVGGPSEDAVPARESQKTKACGKASEVLRRCRSGAGKPKSKSAGQNAGGPSEDIAPARKIQKTKVRDKNGKDRIRKAGTRTGIFEGLLKT